MLLRIFLAIAILAAIATAVVTFLPVKDKITTVMRERDDWHGKYDTTFTELTKTKDNLAKTTRDLESTRKNLADTRTQLEASQNEAASQKKRGDGLDVALKGMEAKWKETDQLLSAWKSLGITVDQVRATVATNKELLTLIAQATREKELLNNRVLAAQQQLEIYRDPEHVVPLPPELIGKIVAVDPKYDFVVIDVGQRQGVLTHGQMLISREGKLVAKVRIKEVEPDRAIANVMPGWKLTDVFEGDVAVSR
jgi:cell shape-determining protein MreC